MADVFLSYSRRDSERAERIKDDIEAAGFSVFWDRGLLGGSQWAKVLERELEGASVVLVLWSRLSVDSEWVRDEAQRAQELGVLAPVLIDDIRPPLGFRQIQADSWVDTESGSPEFLRFIESVEKRAGAVRRAGERVSAAFRRRSQGDFEGATQELSYALQEFERGLDHEEKRRHDQAKGYKQETLGELRVIIREAFNGDLKETLSGLSLLPIVDAVLELDMEPVRELLGPSCPVEARLANEERVRVGAVVRPGSDINSELLVSQLLKETERRGGALDLHCFFLIMNTDDPGPGDSFTQIADRRQLSAKCITWRPVDGPVALAERLRKTILTVCAGAATDLPTSR